MPETLIFCEPPPRNERRKFERPIPIIFYWQSKTRHSANSRLFYPKFKPQREHNKAELPSKFRIDYTRIQRVQEDQRRPYKNSPFGRPHLQTAISYPIQVYQSRNLEYKPILYRRIGTANLVLITRKLSKILQFIAATKEESSDGRKQQQA